MMASLRHNAAPTPRPMEMSMELGEQSPKNRSATSAALVSLPTITGTPVAFSTSVFSGSSLHPKCTDLRTTPLGSTMPVTAMPMPRIGSGVELMSCLHQADHVIDAAAMVDGKLGAVHDSAGKIRQRSFDEHRIRQVDGDDSPEIGVDGEHL